jgi:hypothetical protein
MNLKKRLDRLESKRGGAALGPSVIFICAAETSEPLAAIVMGGGTLTREEGETVLNQTIAFKPSVRSQRSDPIKCAARPST